MVQGPTWSTSRSLGFGQRSDDISSDRSIDNELNTRDLSLTCGHCIIIQAQESLIFFSFSASLSLSLSLSLSCHFRPVPSAYPLSAACTPFCARQPDPGSVCALLFGAGPRTGEDSKNPPTRPTVLVTDRTANRGSIDWDPTTPIVRFPSIESIEAPIKPSSEFLDLGPNPNVLNKYYLNLFKITTIACHRYISKRTKR